MICTNSTTQHTRKLPFTVLAFLLIVIHFAFLMVYFEPAISTPDAQGYFAQAKLIAKQGKTYLEPESIVQYVGPHWLHRSDNHYFTTFPPGLPTILAVIYKILGPKATLIVNPLMASLALFGLFLLCRLLIGGGWALLAVALMAVNPFANEHALFGDSHTAVIFFLIWALFFLVKWLKADSPWWALLTGLFIGAIPTIRYPEVLFTVAFGIFVLIYFIEKEIAWRSFAAGVVGVVIPISALCIRNRMAFGAFWKTGYSLSNEPAQFGLTYFTSYALPYLQMLITRGCGLIFILGVIGILVLCIRRNTRKQGVLFAMLVVPVTLVYMAYFWKPDPQSMRFLLPTFFVYTIASVWLLYLLTKGYRLIAWGSSAALFLITFFWGLPQLVRPLQRLKEQNAVLVKVTSIVEKHVEPGSILIANEGINQHLDFIGYWRLVDASILNFARQRPIELLTPSQNIHTQKVLRNVEARLKYENLKKQEVFNAFSQDVWQWAGKDRKVYWVANEEQINGFKSQLSQYDKLVMIEKIELPEVRLDNFDMHHGPKPPTRWREQLMVPQGPMGPNQIFDIILSGEPLFLVEWIRGFQ